MSNPTCTSLLRKGTVTACSPRGVVVVVDVSLESGCQQCAKGRGCGMGLINKRQQEQVVINPGGSPFDYPVGSPVTLTLEKNDLSLLALLVYALPLFIALMVSGGAAALDGSEWLCAALFFGTLGSGVVALKYLLRGRMERFRPRLVS